MQLLAKMCGWNGCGETRVRAWLKAQQELVEVIARLRGRGASRTTSVLDKLPRLAELNAGGGEAHRGY